MPTGLLTVALFALNAVCIGYTIAKAVRSYTAAKRVADQRVTDQYDHINKHTLPRLFAEKR
jgi:hypothetical protein